MTTKKNLSQFHELLSNGQSSSKEYLTTTRKKFSEIAKEYRIDDLDIKLDLNDDDIEDALVEYAQVKDRELTRKDICAFKGLWDSFHKQFRVNEWSFVPPENYVFRRLFRIINVPNGYKWCWSARDRDDSVADDPEWIERYKRWKTFYFKLKNSQKRL